MDPVVTFITGVIDKGGPSAIALIFAVLYWRADSERREITKVVLDLHPRLLTALGVIQSILDSGRNGANGGGK